jgi:hypothetical protein
MTDIPTKITLDQYDKLMRELWELRQKIACFNTISKHQEDIEALYEQNAMIIKEQKMFRKMLVKIGAKLFQKATTL